MHFRSSFKFSSLHIISSQETEVAPPSHNELKFGKHFTNHMLKIKWNCIDGWDDPYITPYECLQLDPAASVFHYATEGMSARRDSKGKIKLFRPMLNMKRFNESAFRLMLPTFNEFELLQCIKALVHKECHCFPDDPQSFLYIRPFMIGTHKELGVRSSKSALLVVICCLGMPYYEKNIGLVAWEEFVRIPKHGAGEFKLGCNYAPCIKPQVLGMEIFGCEQNLWLHSDSMIISEAGTMNVFMAVKTGVADHKSMRIVTPKLDGTVLNGVLRQSIIDVCKNHLTLEVCETTITIFEFLGLVNEGKIAEVFGSGTAAGIVTIDRIVFRCEEFRLPTDGALAKTLRDLFHEILEDRIDRYKQWNDPIN